MTTTTAVNPLVAAVQASLAAVSTWRGPHTSTEDGEQRLATLLHLARAVLANPHLLPPAQAARIVLLMPVILPGLPVSATDHAMQRMLLRAFFALALRRTVGTQALPVVDVRRVVVELLLRSGALPSTESDVSVSPIQPFTVLATALAVTGLATVRLVSEGTSGLPSGTVQALTNALRFVPKRLHFLAEQRRYRKRGMFESKEEQERGLEIVAALRVSLLDLLNLLFEDGVAPAAAYALVSVREIGYKRRDFHTSASAAFVGFCCEPAAAAAALLNSSSLGFGGGGFSDTSSGSKMQAASQQLSAQQLEKGRKDIDAALHAASSIGSKVLLLQHVTKTALKASYQNGELRNSTLECDTVMQLALCHLMLSLRCSTTTTTSPTKLNASYLANERDRELAATILVAICRTSPDSAVACCALLGLIDHVLYYNCSGAPGAPSSEAARRISSVIHETLSSLAVRVCGALELEVVAAAVPAFAFATATALTSGISPLSFGGMMATHSSGAGAAGGYSSLIAVLPERALARLMSHASTASTSVYANRVRRLAAVLCAKLLELLASLAAAAIAADTDDSTDSLLVGDAAVSQFLAWMARSGLKLCAAGAVPPASFELASHALTCALQMLRGELRQSSNSGKKGAGGGGTTDITTRRMQDAFDQLCCELDLRLP